MTTADPKINPAYYDGDACMRCIAAMTKNMDGPMGFCVGQAVKYLWRAGTKPGEQNETDRAKAQWYLDWIFVFNRSRSSNRWYRLRRFARALVGMRANVTDRAIFPLTHLAMAKDLSNEEMRVALLKFAEQA